MKDRYTDRRMYFEELAQTSREYILKYISTFVTTEPDYRIIEIGCGEGGNLVPFAEIGCKVCGIDLSIGKIANARKFFDENGLEGEFVCSDFVRCDIEPHIGMYDVIIMHDVIEHIEPEDKMEFMSRAKVIEAIRSNYVCFPGVEDAIWRTSADMQEDSLPSALHSPSS